MSLLKAYLSKPRTQRVLGMKPGTEGFSLIELVIVVAVLAVLAAIAVPAFTNMAEDARKAAAQASLANIYKECEVNKMQNGAATHTALAATQAGVTYSGQAILTTCADANATGTTSSGNAYSINT